MIWTVRRQSYTPPAVKNGPEGGWFRPAILGGQVLLAFSTVCMALHSVCARRLQESCRGSHRR